MNPHKLNLIVEYLRKEGKGFSATHEQLLSCYGLDRLLPIDEQETVRRELAAITEAETFMDRLRLSVDRWQ